MAKNKAKIDQHIKQWMHNRSLISQIPPSHPDWIVTVVFYTAVHAIDSALAHEGQSAWNHETRFALIAETNRLQNVGKLYHPLYDLCRKVRYLANPNDWIPPEQIDKQVIRNHLLPLENSVQALIGKDLNLGLIDMSHLAHKKLEVTISLPPEPVIPNASQAANRHETPRPVSQ